MSQSACPGMLQVGLGSSGLPLVVRVPRAALEGGTALAGA
jgi:hypothetical protein